MDNGPKPPPPDCCFSRPQTIAERAQSEIDHGVGLIERAKKLTEFARRFPDAVAYLEANHMTVVQ